MRGRLPLVGILLGAIAFLDFAVFVPAIAWWPVCGLGKRSLFMWLVYNHVLLLGIWSGLAGRLHPWRLVGVIVLSVTLFGPGADEMAAMVMVGTTATGLPLLVVRCLGLELTDLRQGDVDACPSVLLAFNLSGSEAGEQDRAPDRYRFQFSLRSLLAWTAALAVSLSALQFMPKGAFDAYLSWDSLLYLGSYILVSLAAVWTALGTKRLGARIEVLGLAVIAGTVPGCIHWYPSLREILAVLMLAFLSALFFAGLLWIVRLGGYRLLWRHGVRS